MYGKIQKQIFKIMISVAVLPILFIGLLIIWQSFQLQVEQSIHFQEEILKRAKANVSFFLHSSSGHLSLISSIFNILSISPKEQKETLSYMLLHTSKTHHQLFQSIALYNASKEMLFCKSLNGDCINDKEQSHTFQLLIEESFNTQTVEFEAFTYNDSEKIASLYVAIPILDEKLGVVSGIISAKIYMKELWKILHDIQIKTKRYAYIVNQKGRVLVYSNSLDIQAQKKLQNPQNNGVRKGLFNNIVILQGCDIRIGKQAMRIITEYPLSKAISFTTQTICVIILFTTLTIVMSIILSVFMGKKIVVPISKLTTKAEQVEQGDFVKPVNLNQNDEFGELARAFNRMSKTIENQIVSLKKSIMERDSALNSLSQSYGEMAQLSYISAHHLQEPVRVIVNYSDLLDKKYSHLIEDSGSNYLSHIRKNSIILKSMLQDILQYLSLNTTTMKKVQIDTQQVVNEELEFFSLALKKCSASVNHFNLPVIHTDPSLFQKILEQLISNAIKFKSDTPLIITISARPSEKGYIFEIADNGIGIESQYTTKVFDLFYRLHPRDNYSGTGLGLALCKKILTILGGWIRIENHSDGTLVAFMIPEGEIK